MSWSTPAFEELAERLALMTGLAFSDLRMRFAEAGFRRAMEAVHERDARAFLRRIESEPALLQAVIAEVAVGETYFHRDPTQFEVIHTTVFPEIFARQSDAHFWSAGCASGEEPYSLAMLLADAGRGDRAQIIGTDVSLAAIETARRGRYGTRSFRGGSEAWRARYFVQVGKHWVINPQVRDRVTFAVHNLTEATPDDAVGNRSFDLILCRNVLIYFGEQAVTRAVRVLAEHLAPGGWLLTSPTDPMLPESFGLESVITPAGIVYRRKPLRACDVAVVQLHRMERRPSPPRIPFPHGDPPRSGAPRPSSPVPSATISDSLPAAPHLADALRLLDTGEPAKALVSARRARYLDRSCAVAHLALGRALRLCGQFDAAQRSLRRSRVLLSAQAPGELVHGIDGITAGALVAVVAAEIALLASTELRRS